VIPSTTKTSNGGCMNTQFVNCFQTQEYLGKTTLASSYVGEVSIKWLVEEAARRHLVTGAREYQREKVAILEWKQDLIKTVLCDPYARIPQLHIRVIKNCDTSGIYSFSYEIIDGQQRTTTIIDFVGGYFSLAGKKAKDVLTTDRKEIGTFTGEQLLKFFPNLHNEMMNYTISVIWYENLTDQQVSDLFVNVLNNQNSLNDQEKRNSMRGEISEFIRNLARPLPTDKKNTYALFNRTVAASNKIIMQYIPGLKVTGRMEADAWLSELVYMCEHNLRNGVTPKLLTNWVRKSQLPSGWAAHGNTEFNSYEKRWRKLLDWTLDMVKSVSVTNKHRLTPMLIQVLSLYAWEIEKSSDNRLMIKDKKKFTDMFFAVMDKWNSVSVYGGHKKWNKENDMSAFKDLFGGKNSNAIKTIIWVLDRERGINYTPDNYELAFLGQQFSEKAIECLEDWGIMEMDPRTTFPQEMIYKKWKEQDSKCSYTGRPIEIDDLAGDHYVPRSAGIKAGGITEYSNLVVTDRKTNGRKAATHGDDFKKRMGAV